MHLPLLERLSTSSKGPLPASEKTAPQFQEIESGQRARDDLVERQKAIIDAQTAEILNLRSSKEKYVRWYRTTKDRISELEKEIEAVSRTHEETLEKQNRLIHEMGDRLRRTRGLSTTELTEDTRGESSLSPPDRVSEVEALAIVHDLNENVFQVAANLTEEWEELSSSPSDRFAITGDYVDALSNLYAPALVQQVLDRNPAAVTFLVQSSLCGLVAQITSNWRRNQEVKLLRSVCHLLSLSEGRDISARWKSLTQSLLTEEFHSVSIIRQVADILWLTGSFPSTQHSFDFVKAKASNGIETIGQLVLRLGVISTVDILSSDMCLLFESPCTVFNDARMAKEIGFDGTPTSGERDIVAGTTELGVERSVCEGQGVGRRMEILLKTKVVLEKDLTDL